MSFFTKTTFGLKILQWNCRHLNSVKLVELKNFIEEFSPDLISLQEVKLNQEQANLFLRFHSHSVYYKPRKKKTLQRRRRGHYC